MLFLYLTLSGPIIFAASGNGILAPVSISATERTAQITAACIASMGEKQYVAMPASCQALSQAGLFFEKGSDNPIILRNDTADLFSTVPVTNKLKTWILILKKQLDPGEIRAKKISQGRQDQPGFAY
jgi:hypothetical protein